MKKIIFFDLDGTIVDSAAGIIESVKYALSYFGIEEKDQKKLNVFIGPPLIDAFSKNYDMSREDANKAVEKYRENYNKNNAIEKFSVYEGVEEMLKILKEKGFIICLATAKPLIFAKKILEKANLSKYFNIINGASLNESKNSKTAVIKEIIEENNFKKSEILMVGDRENDIEGAKNNGIDVLGVLYGYGSKEELKKAGCERFSASPKEVVNFIIRK